MIVMFFYKDYFQLPYESFYLRICGTIVELCDFFKKLTSRTLHVADLNKMGEDIVFILCKMEQIFSPVFFDIMVHLTVHLPHETILVGSVSSWWMYLFERYLGALKKYVRNKARPEGSIEEGYIVNEVLTFTSLYMLSTIPKKSIDIESKFLN
ncbi:hypothetical protein Pfo_025655 [Paulownia fortunei]|nr:hypothetical protein Pfo_025655 [Paulownia fortunei]